MAKNVLFLVTGMTPQIITETVWALACDPNNTEQWIPDEIHVMSTQDGLNQIRSRLFIDGIFAKFQQDYPHLAQIKFDDSFLHVIKDENKSVLKDLKTPDDNTDAANDICEKIREFTAQDDIGLHVSIAGGRKTMGFYAGYALSLYGRAQDSMSHVLVEDQFESARDFFYPTLYPDFVTNRDGKELDTQDAKIWLANIQFVRMKDAIKEKHQLKGNDNFSKVVNKINESFKDVKLKINLDQQTVEVNDQFMIDDLSPREFAMLHWFADRRKQGLGGIIAPTKHITSSGLDANELETINKLTMEFMPYYEDVKNISEETGFSVDKKFFEGVKSHLKAALETALGLELAAKMPITQERNSKGILQRGTPFYLDLDPNMIEIIDKFKN